LMVAATRMPPAALSATMAQTLAVQCRVSIAQRSPPGPDRRMSSPAVNKEVQKPSCSCRDSSEPFLPLMSCSAVHNQGRKRS